MLATTFGRSRLIGRAIDYLSFYVSMFGAVLNLTRRGDIIVAKTDPPLVSIIAACATLMRRGLLVNWLQDVFPEVAIRLQVRLVRGWIGQLLMMARDWSLNVASANVTLGDQMGDYIASRTRDQERVYTIANWNASDIRPIAHDKNPLRAEWGLENKFVVGYSGNLGRAHEFETLLAGAAILKGDMRIIFLFIGGGHFIEEVRQEAHRLGMSDQFIFKPYQSLDRLSHSLSVADVHWVSLRPELEGFVVPSKFYGIAGAGRPTIAITAKHGQIARLIERYDCGIQVDPGDGRGFFRAILRLANNPELCMSWGVNARRMVETDFSREHAVQNWKNLLETIEK